MYDRRIQMYAKYIQEREGKSVLETEHGFAIYHFLGDYLYLVDIYVEPDYRRTGLATEILNQIKDIAKKNNYKKILGSVDLQAKGCTGSLKAILASGFMLKQCEGQAIYLELFL